MVNNKLQVFNYNGNEVRTAEVGGEIWWVLKDVCKVLEMTTKHITERLDKDEVNLIPLADSIGREQKTTIINESGLYHVILRSDKPQAKPFRKWVTSEVLPSIRKHGLYAADDLLNNPDFLISALTALKEEREHVKALQSTVAVQEQKITEMQPKASYYDIVLNCRDLMTTTQIAKDYGKSARWLNTLLCDKKVQFKQGDAWVLYKKYAEQGYASSKTFAYDDKDGETHTKVNTCWTPKGRLFIYKLLKSLGVLPIVEQTR